MDWLHSEVLTGILTKSLDLRQPIFAIQLENIEKGNFDGLLAKHQISQFSSHPNFALHSMYLYIVNYRPRP